MLVADVSNDGDDSVDMEEWVRLVNNIYRGMNDWQVRISFLSHNLVFLFLLLVLSTLGISGFGLVWIGLLFVRFFSFRFVSFGGLFCVSSWRHVLHAICALYHRFSLHIFNDQQTKF